MSEVFQCAYDHRLKSQAFKVDQQCFLSSAIFCAECKTSFAAHMPAGIQSSHQPMLVESSGKETTFRWDSLHFGRLCRVHWARPRFFLIPQISPRSHPFPMLSTMDWSPLICLLKTGNFSSTNLSMLNTICFSSLGSHLHTIIIDYDYEPFSLCLVYHLLWEYWNESTSFYQCFRATVLLYVPIIVLPLSHFWYDIQQSPEAFN